MPFEITFLDSDRRVREGRLWDVIDYRFRVFNGQSSVTVAVGITGQYHDPAAERGSKKLSQGDRIEAARAWLCSRLDKKESDPFNRRETDSTMDLPSAVMDYWIEHHSIPHWL